MIPGYGEPPRTTVPAARRPLGHRPVAAHGVRRVVIVLPVARGGLGLGGLAPGRGGARGVGRVEECRLALPAGGDETGTYLLLDQIRAAVRLRLVLGRGSFSAGVFLATGPGVPRGGVLVAPRFVEARAGGRLGCRGSTGVAVLGGGFGVAAGHAVVDRSRAGAGAVLGGAHGDRDLDLAAEPAAERLGDGRAQPRLDHVTGEGVRDGEQSGVLDDRAEAGQPEVGTLLGGDDLVGEFVGRRGPHRGEIDRSGHRPCTPSPCFSVTADSPTGCYVSRPAGRCRLWSSLRRPQVIHNLCTDRL